MLIINVYKYIPDGLYYPCEQADLALLQHVVNDDVAALNEFGLSKARYVAAAHNWKVEVVAEPQ